VLAVAGAQEVIDPLTALAGIQAAVALIKKVSKTVDDVSSLGPVPGVNAAAARLLRALVMA